jgi:hypothetical protein
MCILTLPIIEIFGTDWISALHQESLPEDITALRNLFSKVFLMYSDQKYQSQTIDFSIHQIHGGL